MGSDNGTPNTVSLDEYAMGFLVFGPPAGTKCSIASPCPAIDTLALINTSPTVSFTGPSWFSQQSASFLLTGLTPGSTVFKAQFKCSIQTVQNTLNPLPTTNICFVAGSTIMVTPY
jgi:hypothetical protein